MPGCGVVVEAVTHQHTLFQPMFADNSHQPVGFGLLGGVLPVNMIDQLVQAQMPGDNVRGFLDLVGQDVDGVFGRGQPGQRLHCAGIELRLLVASQVVMASVGLYNPGDGIGAEIRVGNADRDGQIGTNQPVGIAHQNRVPTRVESYLQRFKNTLRRICQGSIQIKNPWFRHKNRHFFRHQTRHDTP